MMEFLKKLMQMIAQFMASNGTEKSKTEISQVPMYGDKGPHVASLQRALKNAGIDVKVDSSFGDKTKEAVRKFQLSKDSGGSGIVGPKTLGWLGLTLKKQTQVEASGETPWMDEIEKDMGKNETDKKLQAKLVPYWKRTGLNYKTLVGSKYAWCGLAVAGYLLMGGVNIDVGGFYRARNLDKAGVAIDYKRLGIPFGAIVTLNNKGNCKLSKSNHVTFSASECTPEMIRTKNSYFIGRGGNQNNRVKDSGYGIYKICAVRSPDPKKLPVNRMITKNKRCAVGKVAAESTR